MIVVRWCATNLIIALAVVSTNLLDLFAYKVLLAEVYILKSLFAHLLVLLKRLEELEGI